MTIFIIAEAGSSWDCDINKAFRLIDAAKACGASAVKFQWTSNAKAMAERRLGPNSAGPTQMYKRYLEYPLDVLKRLKAHCDSVGIGFLCTAYLIEDIRVIEPLVGAFKVSAFECRWKEFVDAHGDGPKEIWISCSRGPQPERRPNRRLLHCVSQYPTPLNELYLRSICLNQLDGLSDHTTSLLTGALATAMGVSIIEKHIRLHDTDKDNPDYGHSLQADEWVNSHDDLTFRSASSFKHYVQCIREAEKAL